MERITASNGMKFVGTEAVKVYRGTLAVRQYEAEQKKRDKRCPTCRCLPQYCTCETEVRRG